MQALNQRISYVTGAYILTLKYHCLHELLLIFIINCNVEKF